ncbi:MAG: DUF5134 domain-containing protein, partial [Actinomycetota bacterium]|nr:DUF5134 domain-containing protein [Actinomycetota bacterium]
MASAIWVRWMFAAVFVAVALLSTVRLLVAREDASRWGAGTGRSADVSHGLMSLGMAAMFWPWGNPVPALYWEVIFSVTAGWFAVRLLRRASRAAQVQQLGTTGS